MKTGIMGSERHVFIKRTVIALWNGVRLMIIYHKNSGKNYVNCI